jgi:hypothetical protein
MPPNNNNAITAYVGGNGGGDVADVESYYSRTHASSSASYTVYEDDGGTHFSEDYPEYYPRESLPFTEQNHRQGRQQLVTMRPKVHPVAVTNSNNNNININTSNNPNKLSDFEDFASDAEKLSAILKLGDVELYKHMLTVDYYRFRKYMILIPTVLSGLVISILGFIAASDIIKPYMKVGDTEMREFLILLVSCLGFLVLLLAVLGSGLDYSSKVGYHRSAAEDLAGLCERVRLYRVERAMDERLNDEEEEMKGVLEENDDDGTDDTDESDDEEAQLVPTSRELILQPGGGNGGPPNAATLRQVQRKLKQTKRIQKQNAKLTKDLVANKIRHAREEQDLTKDAIAFYGYHTELHQISRGCRSDVPPQISKFFVTMENRVELMSLSRLGVEEESRMRKNQIVRLCANEIYNEVSNYPLFPLMTPRVDKTIEGALKRVGQLLNMNYRARRRCKLIPCCPIPLCCKKKTTDNVFMIINEGIDQRELDMMQAERIELVRMENQRRSRLNGVPDTLLEMKDTFYVDDDNNNNNKPKKGIRGLLNTASPASLYTRSSAGGSSRRTRHDPTILSEASQSYTFQPSNSNRQISGDAFMINDEEDPVAGYIEGGQQDFISTYDDNTEFDNAALKGMSKKERKAAKKAAKKEKKKKMKKAKKIGLKTDEKSDEDDYEVPVRIPVSRQLKNEAESYSGTDYSQSDIEGTIYSEQPSESVYQDTKARNARRSSMYSNASESQYHAQPSNRRSLGASRSMHSSAASSGASGTHQPSNVEGFSMQASAVSGGAASSKYSVYSEVSSRGLPQSSLRSRSSERLKAMAGPLTTALRSSKSAASSMHSARTGLSMPSSKKSAASSMHSARTGPSIHSARSTGTGKSSLHSARSGRSSMHSAGTGKSSVRTEHSARTGKSSLHSVYSLAGTESASGQSSVQSAMISEGGRSDYSSRHSQSGRSEYSERTDYSEGASSARSVDPD